MFQNIHTFLLFVLLFCGLLASCSDDGVSSDRSTPSSGFPYIDEPLVLATGDVCQPAVVIDSLYIFDLSEDTLFRSGKANDLLLYYCTPESCDECNWIYNNISGTWDSVLIVPQLGPCMTMFDTQTHTLSALDFRLEDHLNGSCQVRITRPCRCREHEVPGNASYTIMTGALHPGYKVLPLTRILHRRISSIARADDGFWVTSYYPNDRELYFVSLEGTPLLEIPLPDQYINDLAVGNDFLWISSGTDRIYRMNPADTSFIYFTVPTDFPGGLAWGDGSLWLAEYQGDKRVFRIDPVASCNTHEAVIIDTIHDVGTGSRSMAWDGSHLLMASNRLYVVNTDGTIETSYEWQVSGAKGMDFADGVLYLVSHGPMDWTNEEECLSWFRLR